MKRATPLSPYDLSRAVTVGLGIVLLAVMCVLALPRPTQAQATLKIAAVVNDDIISVYDLSQRIRLVIAFSNLPNNAQTQQKIAPSVLRRLIVETLHMQEAKRLKIEIKDAEVDQSIAAMEKNNHMPPGGMTQFLAKHGIDKETLTQQIRAELAWVSVVRTLFRGNVNVSDQEVDDILKRMKAEAGKTEYLVAEIFLPFDDKPQQEVEQSARRIHQQLAEGASWPQMAANFSQAASAANGGDMGWNLASDLGPVLGKVVPQLKPNQISQPIRTEDGVYLVLLRATRIAKGFAATPAQVTVGLQQLHLPIAAGASPVTVASVTDKAVSLARGAKSCDALDGIGKTEGDGASGFLGKFKLSQLNPKIRDLVKDLKANQVSQPLRTPDGVSVFMVCSRETQGGKDPIAEARARITRRLINEQLGRLAKQHDEKLRRQAFIDIRL